jgi:DTW domain-containing protein
MREHCHRCRKAIAVCICPHVPRVRNRTEIVILQHPKEREHPFGTARFAELGLERVRTVVHYGLARAPSPLGSLPEGAALIYPARSATDLRSVPPPRALVFLDGTWAQSRTLYRINPALAALPHHRIEPRILSRYKIRSEPAVHCTSTIEAIAEALAIVEPELEGLDPLIAAFEEMIARQIDYQSRPQPRRRTRLLTKPESRAIPEVLREGRRTIVAHCELSRDEVVYVAASDLLGATFECLVKPTRPPDAWWLAIAGLEGGPIMEQGVTVEELRARWNAFAKRDDLLASWNRSTTEILGELLQHPTRTVLKTAYCNVRSARAGTLDEVIYREGLEPVLHPFTGRTGRWLARLIPVARWILGR